MELRDIEIFLTLAEELHFRRTAERLRLTPASITQSIRKQERQIGALLFERTNRSVRLTAVGEQLRSDLRPVYLELEDSVRRAKLAARRTTVELRVGLLPFNTGTLRDYWSAFRGRHPECALSIHRAPFADTFGALRAGVFDALVVWLPVEEPDLTVGPVLFTDERRLAVSEDHELADAPSVSVESFADYRHAVGPDMPPVWEAAYLPFVTPSGRPIERGPAVTTSDELINLVTSGEIVHAFPAHVTEYWAVPHIRWLPVTDLPPLPYALVWRSAAESEPLRQLAAVVADLAAPAA
ncbi:LysR family transcriptional regulator [Nocardia sp. 2]|uniref:LysR family transcriptional regulator n=1 Tax=Nocardia acididurans TaxID=2802282 RepID=A0ABS1MA63_9NOCA|nr:LysR family transcriptional regulator [Nocardia acididurans]MBL1077035.1 LysR family transcriptional regulator [Nocardia acididurans]